MRQQINLYQTARPTTLPVSAHTLLVVTLLMSTVLMGLWGYGLIAVNALQQQANLLVQQRDARTRMLEQGTALLSAQVDPVALHQEVQQLSERVAQRQQTLLAMRRRAPTAQTGFATRLTALAQPHIAGVWLDSIVLRGGAGIDHLSGRSLDATLVAGYLRALGSEPALQGARFSDVHILGSRYVDPQTETPDTGVAVKPKAATTGVRFRVDATSAAAMTQVVNTGSPT